MRPINLINTKHNQNPNQYGYTEGVSYLLAALHRHEHEKFCIDTKKTFFALSLDSASAFDVLNRDIQITRRVRKKVREVHKK